jgi:hypothetical protein
LVSPLLGPLPTRSSQGEDGELDAVPASREHRAGKFEKHEVTLVL